MTSNHLKILFRLIAVLLAGMHTWAAVRSQSMNADGISYLDIGDAYFRGDWANAINPVWSPMYSWFLGLTNFIVKPSMEWEFPTVHIINLLIFIFAMMSFEFMWGRVRLPNTSGSSTIHLPEWLWWSLGYLLFIWTSLSLIQIWAVTPDMLMAAFVFLAGGLVANIRRGETKWRIFLLLGVVLGLGYLTKTFMILIAPVFLGLIIIVAPKKKNILLKTFFSIGIFLLISVPFILLISDKKGRFTIGEAGTVTYVRHVHGIPYPHWQGEPERNIILKHPSRRIHDSPPVYEFSEPVGGSYPQSTDPSYWYEGIELPNRIEGQIARLLSSSLYYLDLFAIKQGMLFACITALYFIGSRQNVGLMGVLKRWALMIPALAAFGLYGLVLVADRYIGVFVVLFWADILANIKLPASSSNRTLINVFGSIAAVGLIVNLTIFNLDGIRRLSPTSGITMSAAYEPIKPLRVAQELTQHGIMNGDYVGVIGYGFDSFWARLARVQITAEMLEYEAGDFWLGDDDLQAAVMEAFASTGVKAVVAEFVPYYARLNGWKQVDNSYYFIYLFAEEVEF
jgi:hypothetical protein